MRAAALYGILGPLSLSLATTALLATPATGRPLASAARAPHAPPRRPPPVPRRGRPVTARPPPALRPPPRPSPRRSRRLLVRSRLSPGRRPGAAPPRPAGWRSPPGGRPPGASPSAAAPAPRSCRPTSAAARSPYRSTTRGPAASTSASPSAGSAPPAPRPGGRARWSTTPAGRAPPACRSPSTPPRPLWTRSPRPTTSSATRRAESAAPPRCPARAPQPSPRRRPAPRCAPPPRTSGERMARAQAYARGCARADGPRAAALHHAQQRPRPRRPARRARREASSTSWAPRTAPTSAPSTRRSSPAMCAAWSSTAWSTPAPGRSGTATTSTSRVAFERRWADWRRWVARHDAVYHLGRTPRGCTRSYEKARAGLADGRRAAVGTGAAAATLPRRRLQRRRLGRGARGPRRLSARRPAAAGRAGRARTRRTRRATRTATPSTPPWSATTPPGRATGRLGPRQHRARRRAPFETWDNAWMNLPCAYWPAGAGTARWTCRTGPVRCRRCCSWRPNGTRPLRTRAREL